jgi:hypothetical protein
MEQKKQSTGESARLEHCPKCDSTDVRNHMYFREGQPIRVYVRCARCDEFVARYTLRGYTSDTIYESILERLRYQRLSSGRRALRIIEEFGADVADEYRHVLELIRTNEDQRPIEEIIADEYSGERE